MASTVAWGVGTQMTSLPAWPVTGSKGFWASARLLGLGHGLGRCVQADERHRDHHQAATDEFHHDHERELLASDDDGRDEDVYHARARPRVSGIHHQHTAASRNAAEQMVSAAPNPCVWARLPTANGAAALAIRPVL